MWQAFVNLYGTERSTRTNRKPDNGSAGTEACTCILFTLTASHKHSGVRHHSAMAAAVRSPKGRWRRRHGPFGRGGIGGGTTGHAQPSMHKCCSPQEMLSSGTQTSHAGFSSSRMLAAVAWRVRCARHARNPRRLNCRARSPHGASANGLVELKCSV